MLNGCLLFSQPIHLPPEPLQLLLRTALDLARRHLLGLLYGVRVRMLGQLELLLAALPRGGNLAR